MKTRDQYSNYFFTPKSSDSEIYVTVETYPRNTVDEACTTGTFTYGTQSFDVTAPVIYFGLYDSRGNLLGYKFYVESSHTPMILKPGQYKAGEKYKIEVYVEFFKSPARDYTVGIYSDQDIQITDENG